jgi:hypothetical protein
MDRPTEWTFDGLLDWEDPESFEFIPASIPLACIEEALKSRGILTYTLSEDYPLYAVSYYLTEALNMCLGYSNTDVIPDDFDGVFISLSEEPPVPRWTKVTIAEHLGLETTYDAYVAALFAPLNDIKYEQFKLVYDLINMCTVMLLGGSTSTGHATAGFSSIIHKLGFQDSSYGTHGSTLYEAYSTAYQQSLNNMTERTWSNTDGIAGILVLGDSIHIVGEDIDYWSGGSQIGTFAPTSTYVNWGCTWYTPGELSLLDDTVLRFYWWSSGDLTYTTGSGADLVVVSVSDFDFGQIGGNNLLKKQHEYTLGDFPGTISRAATANTIAMQTEEPGAGSNVDISELNLPSNSKHSTGYRRGSLWNWYIMLIPKFSFPTAT